MINSFRNIKELGFIINFVCCGVGFLVLWGGGFHLFTTLDHVQIVQTNYASSKLYLEFMECMGNLLCKLW